MPIIRNMYVLWDGDCCTHFISGETEVERDWECHGHPGQGLV